MIDGVNSSETTQTPSAERRNPERLRMEQSLRAHEAWLNSLDFRVVNGTLKPEEKNRMISLALIRRERRLEREQAKTEAERSKNEIDPMTGLYRQEHLRPEIARRIAQKERFALLLTDLDHFGEVNKKFGQPAGDEIIIEAAFRLTGGIRDGLEDEERADMAFRNGGDESAIILSGISNPDQLKIVAERIRRNMESAPFNIPFRNEQIPLTLSIGGVIWNGEPLNELLDKAGQSLVEAKSQRNIAIIK